MAPKPIPLALAGKKLTGPEAYGIKQQLQIKQWVGDIPEELEQQISIAEFQKANVLTSSQENVYSTLQDSTENVAGHQVTLDKSQPSQNPGLNEDKQSAKKNPSTQTHSVLSHSQQDIADDERQGTGEVSKRARSEVNSDAESPIIQQSDVEPLDMDFPDVGIGGGWEQEEQIAAALFVARAEAYMSSANKTKSSDEKVQKYKSALLLAVREKMKLTSSISEELEELRIQYQSLCSNAAKDKAQLQSEIKLKDQLLKTADEAGRTVRTQITELQIEHKKEKDSLEDELQEVKAEIKATEAKHLHKISDQQSHIHQLQKVLTESRMQHKLLEQSQNEMTKQTEMKFTQSKQLEINLQKQVQELKQQLCSAQGSLAASEVEKQNAIGQWEHEVALRMKAEDRAMQSLDIRQEFDTLIKQMQSISSSVRMISTAVSSSQYVMETQKNGYPLASKTSNQSRKEFSNIQQTAQRQNLIDIQKVSHTVKRDLCEMENLIKCTSQQQTSCCEQIKTFQQATNQKQSDQSTVVGQIQIVKHAVKGGQQSLNVSQRLCSSMQQLSKQSRYSLFQKAMLKAPNHLKQVQLAIRVTLFGLHQEQDFGQYGNLQQYIMDWYETWTSEKDTVNEIKDIWYSFKNNTIFDSDHIQLQNIIGLVDYCMPLMTTSACVVLLGPPEGQPTVSCQVAALPAVVAACRGVPRVVVIMPTSASAMYEQNLRKDIQSVFDSIKRACCNSKLQSLAELSLDQDSISKILIIQSSSNDCLAGQQVFQAIGHPDIVLNALQSNTLKSHESGMDGTDLEIENDFQYSNTNVRSKIDNSKRQLQTSIHDQFTLGQFFRRQETQNNQDIKDIQNIYSNLSQCISFTLTKDLIDPQANRQSFQTYQQILLQQIEELYSPTNSDSLQNEQQTDYRAKWLSQLMDQTDNDQVLNSIILLLALLFGVAKESQSEGRSYIGLHLQIEQCNRIYYHKLAILMCLCGRFGSLQYFEANKNRQSLRWLASHTTLMRVDVDQMGTQEIDLMTNLLQVYKPVGKRINIAQKKTSWSLQAIQCLTKLAYEVKRLFQSGNQVELNGLPVHSNTIISEQDNCIRFTAKDWHIGIIGGLLLGFIVQNSLKSTGNRLEIDFSKCGLGAVGVVLFLNQLQLEQWRIQRLLLQDIGLLASTTIETLDNMIQTALSSVPSDDCQLQPSLLQITQQLEPGLDSLQHLQFLDFSYNNIGDQLGARLFRLLKTSKIIQVIRLIKTGLGGTFAKQFASFLQQSGQSIQVLELEGNNLGQHGTTLIFQQLYSKCKHLRVLNFNDCNSVTGEAIKCLETLFQSQDTPQELRIRKNPLGIDGCKFLGPTLKTKNFKIVQIDGCQITSEGFQYLANGLKDTAIQHISLSRNQLGDKGVAQLCQCILQSKIFKPVNLELQKNQLGNVAGKLILQALGQKKWYPHYIGLNENQLEESIKLQINNKLKHIQKILEQQVGQVHTQKQ